MKAKSFLPIFSGFYGSIWELDLSYIEQDLIQERKNNGLFSEVDFDDLKIDFEQYEKDVIEKLCKILPEYFEGLIDNITLEKIVHPRAYNFANDSANVIIEYDSEKIRNFVYENKAKFCEYLKARYTSCDGFISHYSNDFEAWESETQNFSDLTVNGHFLGAILEFIARILKIEESAIYENVMEGIFSPNYLLNYEDLVLQSDGSLFEALTSQGINKSYADYIENSFQNNVLGSLSLSEKILSIVEAWIAENVTI